MERKLYQDLATTLGAFNRCRQEPNHPWTERHGEHIKRLLEYFPSGSGFDNGTHLDWEHSTEEKLVFDTAFHHMNENGMYDGWTEHSVTVRPSLQFGFTLSISGRNRNDIKELIAQDFDYTLNRVVGIPPDPFQDVPDYERCCDCRGTASVTQDDKRYCPGCAKRAEDRKLRVGSLIKMSKFDDYTKRGLSPWGWLRVISIAEDSVIVRHAPHPMDASCDDPSVVQLPKSVIDRFHTTIERKSL
jgi:hypothetical protein